MLAVAFMSWLSEKERCLNECMLFNFELLALLSSLDHIYIYTRID